MIIDRVIIEQRLSEVVVYILWNRIDGRHPIESDKNGEVDIGYAMKLLEEVFRYKSYDIVTSSFNVVRLWFGSSSIFYGHPERWMSSIRDVEGNCVIFRFLDR